MKIKFLQMKIAMSTSLVILLMVVGMTKVVAQTPYRQYAEGSILLNFHEIDNVDFRLFLLYNLSQSDQFVLIEDNIPGQFCIVSNNEENNTFFFEAVESLYQNTYADFSLLSKTDLLSVIPYWKSKVPSTCFVSIMMDMTIPSGRPINNHCVGSELFCTSDVVTFAAATTSQTADQLEGADFDYGCIGSAYNPSWYHMRINTPGQIIIHMEGHDPNNGTERDIDYCIWGPFTDPMTPCVSQLTTDKIMDCGYSASYSEDIYLGFPENEHHHQNSHGPINYHMPETGEYYILMICNFSRLPCIISLSQIGGNGTLECSGQKTIIAIADPNEGGAVSGGGSYEIGETCTLVAQANPGFAFFNWTENGEQVSTSDNFVFTVDRDRFLVAHFTTSPYVVTATVEPENSGTISGMGGFEYGQNCTLQAEANMGYTFEKWTENGNTVSTDAAYTFDVTESRNLVAHFKVCTYIITASADPSTNGEAVGSGTYEYGQNCTLRAISNNGYEFVNWTENGEQVSTSANYTFPVTRNRTLVAHFQERSYTISVSANPSIGGIVSGSGSFNNGQTCTVSATPATGYIFIKWTENGAEVSMDANYSFVVTRNRSLVAWFQAPNGSLNGTFSVRSNSKVYFSQGNLQYNPGAGIWQFAENQYEYLGFDNSNISQTYEGWIDLFGWGTSGHYHGYECYQPWATSPDYKDYYASSDLQGTTDWGYNRIVNGGGQYNVWRTLSSEEWNYLLYHRYTPSGIRFAKGRVNNVNGVIIVPDLWNDSFYLLHGANDETASYNSNVISDSDWSMMQNNGAVFLPAAGYRKKTSIQQVDVTGDYWTRSNKDEVFAYCLEFDEDRGQIGSLGRYYGCSVRLVKDVQPASVESNETNAMIYPNPTKDVVYIKGERFERIEVVNTMGQLLMSQEQASSCAELNLNYLSPGIYFLKVYCSKGIVCYRLIKE